MRNIFFVCYICYSVTGIGQRMVNGLSKPIIDSVAINHWPSLGPERAINRDGRYFMYGLENQPVGGHTMVIRSAEGSWKKEFPGVSGGIFAGDGRQFIFLVADTLCFLLLGNDDMKKIIGVNSYSQSGNGKWLVYQLNKDQELVLHDFSHDRDLCFSGVSDYMFDDSCQHLLLKSVSGSSDQTASRLEWVGLADSKISVIWSDEGQPSASLGIYALDHAGRQVCFLTSEQRDGRMMNRLWWWQPSMDRAVERAKAGSEGMDSDLSVSKDYGPQFSGDGRIIYFGLTRNRSIPVAALETVSVDVWNWRDSILQPTQLADHSNPLFTAVTGTGGGRVVRLENDNEYIVVRQTQGDYVVVKHTYNPGYRFWLDRPDSYWLVSVQDGSRILLPVKSYSEFYFSPGGRYLVYDEWGQDGPFTSYELKTGRVCRISTGILAHWLSWSDGFERPLNQHYYPVGLLGWEPADTALLVYDNYDIWKLWLTGSKAPVNISRSYGRAHHIRLRVASEQNGLNDLYQRSDSVLLVGFNTQNKYNGFYRLTLSGKVNPVLLSMGPWTLRHRDDMMNLNPNEFKNAGMPPLKAEDACSWVVIRTTASEAPNYFLTHDFIHYQPLTDLAPQKKYNWLTAELVSWVQPDGITSQGVLYKPEDFDPHKKYPVIIHYYEQLSHRVYEYPQPEYTGGGHINIPWFVSRGFLVFTPDIYYHQFAIGQSACITVESAGKMLAKLPYVDSKRMGIAGHSWGGAETNYIVTHTHLFAAAPSGAAGHNGVDLISNSLAIKENGAGPYNDLVRYEREDIGATLWQRPDLWIQQSPIFQADRITTPFLIFYNKADGGNERAIELFIALHRLGKHVWMLQYDHGGHVVDGKDAEDFTIRVTQFFDHFLKGAPAPVWMTRGIPARLKGVDPGYELDPNESRP